MNDNWLFFGMGSVSDTRETSDWFFVVLEVDGVGAGREGVVVTVGGQDHSTPDEKEMMKWREEGKLTCWIHLFDLNGKRFLRLSLIRISLRWLISWCWLEWIEGTSERCLRNIQIRRIDNGCWVVVITVEISVIESGSIVRCWSCHSKVRES